MAKRRSFSVFNMSFLDCICCGFGAVILLFVVMNARAVSSRQDQVKDLRSEVNRLEIEVLKGEKDKVLARNALDEVVDELAETEGLSREVLQELLLVSNQLAKADGDTTSQREHINKLKSDLKSLEEGIKRLKGGAKSDEAGKAPVEFLGDGERQYLTGLQLKGERTLILVDRSASMLAGKVIDVLRLKNQSAEVRKEAPKWKQARRAVHWIMAKLPQTGTFHVAGYAESTKPVREEQTDWWSAADIAAREEVVSAIDELAPEGGTSLINAFQYAKTLNPPPDNIVLLADGLPGMGKSPPVVKRKISAKRRLSLFRDAVKELPAGTKVNVLLYPMEGDPMGPVAYWNLAVKTRGSLLTPSKDWP